MRPGPASSARPSTTQPSHDGSARDTVRVLFDRNIFPYLAGNTLSGIGTWFQILGQSILVYRLTGSSLWLGIAGFANQVPMFLVAPIAGAWLDRWDRHRVLVWTQILSMAHEH